MKKSKFFITTLILCFGQLFTRSIGFIIKIIYTRIIGTYGISIYSLISPTYSLLINIATFSLPLSISKIISEERHRGKKIFCSIFPLIIIINIILIILMIILSPLIANKFLHNDSVKIYLIAMALTLPFISLSSLIKGYFFGKQNMLPYAISNVIEQIIRLILISSVLPFLIKIDLSIAILGLILLNIISETSSIIVFMFFLPKNINLSKCDIKLEPNIIKDTLKISVPSLSSKLIGSISYFFEPIILTTLLLLSGFKYDRIIHDYGVYNAYSLSLLLMPSFFISAITTSLVPEISSLYKNQKLLKVKMRIKQAILSSFLLGLLCNTVLFLFTKDFLNIIFNTNEGINYIRLLAPFFLLFYIEAPLSTSLIALGKNKVSMNITLFGVILKNIVLITLCLLKFGIYSLIVSEIINIIFVVYLNFKYLNKFIK